MTALLLAATVITGVFIRWAVLNDEAERDWSDIREWHLLHGPNDGCRECETK